MLWKFGSDTVAIAPSNLAFQDTACSQGNITTFIRMIENKINGRLPPDHSMDRCHSVNNVQLEPSRVSFTAISCFTWYGVEQENVWALLNWLFCSFRNAPSLLIALRGFLSFPGFILAASYLGAVRTFMVLGGSWPAVSLICLHIRVELSAHHIGTISIGQSNRQSAWQCYEVACWL